MAWRFGKFSSQFEFTGRSSAQRSSLDYTSLESGQDFGTTKVFVYHSNSLFIYSPLYISSALLSYSAPSSHTSALGKLSGSRAKPSFGYTNLTCPFSQLFLIFYILCLFRCLKPIRCLKLWIILPSTCLGALEFSQKVYLCITYVVFKL